MSEVIGSMQSALELAGGSPGLSAVFLASLIALWYRKFQRELPVGCLFWYGTITLSMLIIPGFLAFVGNFWPELLTDYMILWILPVVPVILIAGVNAFPFYGERKDRAFFLMAFLAILILAGATVYQRNQHNLIENREYIPDSELEMLEKAEEYREKEQQETVLLWADQEIMNYARIYSGHIYLMYGKDLWLGSMDSQMHQIYEDWQQEAYIYMENAPLYMDEIVDMAALRECDILIFSRNLFEMYDVGIPEYLGEGQYLFYQAGKEYLMYVSAGTAE